MPETTRFDVIIVGAGPAGLAAALEASLATSSVAVVDMNPHPGGQIWRRDVHGAQSAAARRYESRAAERATFINGATVVDAWSLHGRHWLKIERAGTAMTLETGTIVLATGARELFLPFPGWTLPGVVGVGGLQALMKSGLDVREKRVAVAGSGPLVVAVAATAARKGAEIVAVVEQASLRAMIKFGLRLAFRPLDVAEGVRFAREIPPGVTKLASWVRSAEGRDRLTAVTIQGPDGVSQVECDYLACAYGLVPNLDLARLFGCTLAQGGIVVDQSQATSVSGIYAAGECTGIGGVNKSLAEGLIAGRAAVGLDTMQQIHRWRAAERRWGDVLDRTFAIRSEVRAAATPDTIVCRCEDVPLGDASSVRLAREAKLYFRVGMGACQGRVCGPALAVDGGEMDTPRPPLHPTALSSLLGAN